MSRHNHTFDGLDVFLERFQEHPSPVDSRLGRFAGFVIAALITALAAGSLATPVALASSFGISAAVDYWNTLPTDLPLNVDLPQHTVLLDKNGKEFARFYSENRIDVPASGISKNFTDALVATEDSRFYEHGAFDLTGTVRAILHNASSSTVQGASTITEQLVQNILVNSARDATEKSVAVGNTYQDKLRELKYAIGLEKKLSKADILTLYSNTVYFGNNAYGVEAAARIYFNTTAEKLTVPQAATLVGLLRGPNIYDPIAHPEVSQDRRNIVIGRLASTHKISSEEATAATKAPLGIDHGALPNGCATSTYPFYCALVRNEILTNTAFGDTPEARSDRLSRGGMTITTALDPQAMDASQHAVNAAMDNTNRAALGTATIKPGTGEISAIAQNRSWGSGDGKTEIVYAASTFQPGSAMKPITLATALEQGVPATTTYNSNSPYTSPTLDSPVSGFQNYGNYSYGRIDARTAIKYSVNTYFIQLIQRVGVIPVADMAGRLGITTLPRTGPRAITGREASLTLGAYEVTPIDMANAYSVFISGGVACNAHTIIAVKRADTGIVLPAPDPQCHQAISAPVANTVADALKYTFSPGGTLGQLGELPGRPSGAKTGTTNDFDANWIVGVTPQWSTAVWLGDPRGGAQYPLYQVNAYGRSFHDLTGSEIAAPVWKDIMTSISAGLPVLPLPSPDDSATSITSSKTVPDVRGMATSAAMTILVQNNLTPVVSSTVAPVTAGLGANTVISQSPVAGSTASFKETITLTLSNGSTTTVTAPVKK